MNVLVFLIPASLFLGILGLGAFVWTLRARQYEDPLGQASRILLEDDSFGMAEPDANTEPTVGKRPVSKRSFDYFRLYKYL